MKTRYKILIVISISVFVYMFIHFAFPLVCQVTFVDQSECWLVWELYLLSGINLESSGWYDGEGIGSWTGTPEGMEPNKRTVVDGVIVQEINYEFNLESNVGFIFLHIIIPALIITGLIIQDKTKGGMRDMRK